MGIPHDFISTAEGERLSGVTLRANLLGATAFRPRVIAAYDARFGYESCAVVSLKVVNAAGSTDPLVGGLEHCNGGISLSHRCFRVPSCRCERLC